MQTGSPSDERRCPDCGALASTDAEWCGQCFRPLIEPEPEPEPAAAASRAARTASSAPTEASEGTRPKDTPTWPCPACGTANGLELDACEVCGTTFASLMRQDQAPRVHPRDALSASLLYPGLGHGKLGRGLDGLARGVLFTVLAVMASTVAFSGVRSAGTFAVFALFLVAALTVYLGTAWEAYHMADGGSPFVSSRILLWATVAVILASVVLLAVSVVSVARR